MKPVRSARSRGAEQVSRLSFLHLVDDDDRDGDAADVDEDADEDVYSTSPHRQSRVSIALPTSPSPRL